MNHPALKPFPVVATKAEIRQIYNRLSRRKVTAAIQLAVDIVNETSTIKYNDHDQILNSAHIRLIREELRDAPGYEPLED